MLSVIEELETGVGRAGNREKFAPRVHQSLASSQRHRKRQASLGLAAACLVQFDKSELFLNCQPFVQSEADRAKLQLDTLGLGSGQLLIDPWWAVGFGNQRHWNSWLDHNLCHRG